METNNKDKDVKEENINPNNIWIEELENQDDLNLLGDRVATALEQFCNIGDVKHVYIKKAGDHLEVGKAEVQYIMQENSDIINAKATLTY